MCEFNIQCQQCRRVEPHFITMHKDKRSKYPDSSYLKRT
jgi:hypothetical protein